jgi:phospholipase/lecithinase/hemolysin
MHKRATLGKGWRGLWSVVRPGYSGRLLAGLLGVALVVTSSLVSAEPFTAIIVIGDSLADSGNAFRATSALPGQAIPVSPPYFRGRFSNGLMWVEHLANALGLQITPSLDGGTNFAFGGATTGQDLNRIFQRDLGVTIPSLRAQVAAYRLTLADPTLSDPTRVKRSPVDALYIVWGGANDLRDVVHEGTAGATPASIASEAVDNISAVIRELQSAGAIYFLVPNLPDLGRTPQQVARGPEAVQLAAALSTAFNNALENTLQQLESTLPVYIARLDIARHFQAVTTSPQNFGVTNVTDACLSGDPFAPGTVCAAPDSYIFWDAIGHPTAVAQALIADFAFAVLPPLVATSGANNPQDELRVSLPLTAQPVLQVRLGMTTEMVRLSQCIIALTNQQGDATRVQTVQATLVNDTNANGTVDAGEAVVATRQVQGPVDMLTLDINPPLELLPNTVTHLLVTLSINSTLTTASTTPVAGLPGLHLASSWSAWSVAFLVALGSIGMLGRRAPSQCLSWILVGLVGGGCLVLMSCNSSGQDNTANSALEFAVSMPVAGLNATGAMSEPLTQPVAAIQGTVLSIAP